MVLVMSSVVHKQIVAAGNCNVYCVGLPYWTAWYVPRHQVVNDLWGQSHFNHAVRYFPVLLGRFLIFFLPRVVLRKSQSGYNIHKYARIFFILTFLGDSHLRKNHLRTKENTFQQWSESGLTKNSQSTNPEPQHRL